MSSEAQEARHERIIEEKERNVLDAKQVVEELEIKLEAARKQLADAKSELRMQEYIKAPKEIG